jgi:PAS domain S-box-containing protein
MSAPEAPVPPPPPALDLLPVGAAYYRAGRFLWVNRTLCELVGYAREHLLGIDPFSLIVPADQERVRERFRARQRGEAPTSVYELQVRRSDGSLAAVESEVRLVGPDEALVLYRDVSPHRRAQRLLEGLAQLAARVQRARTPGDVRTAALDGLLALGFQGAVAAVASGGYALSWRVNTELEALIPRLLVEHLPLGRIAPIDTCLHTLEPVYLEDAIESLRGNLTQLGVPLDADNIAQLRKRGLDKLALAPLSVHGRPYGVLVAVGEGLSRETAAALSLFAAQLASALEVAETIVELQQKNRRLGAINAVATAGEESDPSELAERLLRIVMEATASDMGSAFRSGTEALELEATVNVPTWFAERYTRLPFGTTVTGGTAASRKARALMLEDWPAVHHESLRRVGGLSSALLPLEVKGKLSGALVLVRNRAEPYGAEDLSTAEVLADQVAVQLERARLVLALRKSYDELAHAQKELVKRERLAALGELSAVIAHEVRNPLGVLFNSVGSLKRMPLSDQARTLLGIVSEESERLNRLVSDLLDFARPNEPRLAAESAELLVASAVDTARRGTGLQGVEVRVEVAPGLPAVLVDMQLCRQALLNLLLNAAQATGRGGEVVISARLDSSRQPAAVRVDVRDGGDGIAPEIADRIFQPFFTTRAAGTGLGLALVKRIAEAHRAEIGFESSPGKGTTFSLWLPLAPA